MANLADTNYNHLRVDYLHRNNLYVKKAKGTVGVHFEKKRRGNVILSRSNAEAKNLANALALREILRPAASE